MAERTTFGALGAVIVSETGVRTTPLARSLLLNETTSTGSTNVSLTGLSVTAAIGVLSVGKSISLTGVSANTAIGVLSFGASVTGVAATANIGLPVPNISISLTGVAATAAVGTIVFEEDVNIPLIGVASTGTLGTLVSEIDYTIPSGVQINTSIGTPSLEVSFVVGQQANTGLGIPTASLEVDIIVTGVGAKASIGTPLTNIRTGNQIVMSGRQANAAIGHPSTAVSALFQGMSVSTFIGTPSVISYNGSMQFNDLMVEEGLTIPPDSMVSLRWSDTDGQSWNDPVHRSLGETGDYLRNLQWQRMGMARRGRVYELSWSSPIPTCLLGTSLRFNTGRS